MFFIDFCRRVNDKHGRKTSFIILLSFLAAFIVARIYAILYLFFETPLVFVKGIHVHHLNYGIFFLAISGFLAFYLSGTRWRNKVVILYGIGLGLTFDEFGMWLHLEDHYWIRTSYDAIIIISAILLNSVFFGDFWLRIFGKASTKASKAKARYKEIVEK